MNTSVSRFVPFAYGFRPFFLLALAFAPVAIVVWLGMLTRGALLPPFPAQLWHAHEMIFGFVGAAIAGFLLTAVPSWTGTRGFAGWPLIALTTVWLAGRVAFAAAGSLPMVLVATIELSFLPVLIFLLAPPLLRARNRNTPLLFVVLGLWIADAVFLYGLMNADIALAGKVLRFGVNLICILITVIGGRIVPAFTASALRGRSMSVELTSRRWLEVVVITAMVLIAVIDLGAPLHWAAAALAAIAAGAHVLRMSGWRGHHTLREPIAWVLHLAYAWLPLGLAMKAIYLLSGAPWAAHWLHALTAGCLALMIVAVVTRAALGHTGRPLVVSGWTASAYLIIAAAALVRVFGPAVSASHYVWSLCISGSLWIAGFVLLTIVYAPVLLMARADGRPG
ncbi:MAG: NnrS family protein [Pseudomonadota bacterium]